MRYLKVIAQDRSANGRPDTVKLRFFQKDPDVPDEMVHEAVAFDATADGTVDFQSTGDIDFDGAANLQDRLLLKQFANDVLKLGWFNQGNASHRSIALFMNGSDEAVGATLEFHHRNDASGEETVVISVMADEQQGNGAVVVPAIRDAMGLFDPVRREAIHALRRLYLQFNWR